VTRYAAVAKHGPKWSVSIECDTSGVPADVLEVVRKQLEDLARALAVIEPSNPFWTSLRKSGMRIDIGGWRFKFRVEFGSVALAEAEQTVPF
jgi:hypothetical protein